MIMNTDKYGLWNGMERNQLPVAEKSRDGGSHICNGRHYVIQRQFSKLIDTQVTQVSMLSTIISLSFIHVVYKE